jgi:hypothetical protein
MLGVVTCDKWKKGGRSVAALKKIGMLFQDGQVTG